MFIWPRTAESQWQESLLKTSTIWPTLCTLSPNKKTTTDLFFRMWIIFRRNSIHPTVIENNFKITWSNHTHNRSSEHFYLGTYNPTKSTVSNQQRWEGTFLSLHLCKTNNYYLIFWCNEIIFFSNLLFLAINNPCVHYSSKRILFWKGIQIFKYISMQASLHIQKGY